MTSDDRDKIVSSIRAIALETVPNALERSQYGGIVWAIDEDHKNKLFCGAFVRQGYVTLELDATTELPDPEKLLEGTGKTRRHLKLVAIEDIETKHVREFISRSARNLKP